MRLNNGAGCFAYWPSRVARGLRCLWLRQDRAMRAGVAAVGGWRLACLMQDRDLPTNRAAFRDAYRGALRRGVRRVEVDEIGRITEGPARLLLGIG